MSTVDDHGVLSRVHQTLRIIVGTLTAGLVLFLAIVLFLRSQPVVGPPQPADATSIVPQPQAAGLPLLTTMACVFAATLLPMSVLVPRMVTAGLVRQVASKAWSPPPPSGMSPSGEWTDRLKLASVYQTQLIMGAAMNEGAAFFAGIAYLLEGSPITVALMLVLIVGVAVRFPTRERLDGWIDAQLSRIDEQRLAGM